MTIHTLQASKLSPHFSVDKAARVLVPRKSETVWLKQRRMAEVFGIVGLGASNLKNCRQLALPWPRLGVRQTASGETAATLPERIRQTVSGEWSLKLRSRSQGPFRVNPRPHRPHWIDQP